MKILLKTILIAKELQLQYISEILCYQAGPSNQVVITGQTLASFVVSKLSREWRFFQKLLKAEANRRVRMCNLQSAKDCASVETSLATVRARAQE